MHSSFHELGDSPIATRTIGFESVTAHSEVVAWQAIGSVPVRVQPLISVEDGQLLRRLLRACVDLVLRVLVEQPQLFHICAGCVGSGAHSLWSFHTDLLSFITDVLGVLPGRKVESES
jgi:hypothetical protein